MVKVLRACVIAKSERQATTPWVGSAAVAHRKNAEATHATHAARMVSGSLKNMLLFLCFVLCFLLHLCILNFITISITELVQT
jgi:hypothetical protein